MCRALYWALPLCFVFHLLFQESGGNNYSAELSLNSRGGQVQWAQIIGHWPLCISLHVTSDCLSLYVMWHRPLVTVCVTTCNIRPLVTTCDIRPLVTVCVTTCDVKSSFGGLASSRKWSIVVLFHVCFTCTGVCFTAFYCVLLQLFHSVQRTCLDLSKAIVLYQKRICCKYDLSVILSK